MSRLLNTLKYHKIKAPVWVGKLLSHIPFEIRPGVGKIYRLKKNEIKKHASLKASEKKHQIFLTFFSVFKHAFNNIPFYNDFYQYKHKIDLRDIQTFEDIKLLPIITKDFLQSIPLEERSFKTQNRLLVNTGGSSGKPFSFYMDPMRYGNEWAHLHKMWGFFNYKPNKLMLKFDGRCSGENNIEYDFVRNIFKINLNRPYMDTSVELQRVVQLHKIEYFLGYPSAIFEFLKFCETHNNELLSHLKNTLVCIFFASEYPIPFQRNYIEAVLGVRTHSFYGHTETCVMASETKKYIFKPFQTYGLSEAIKQDGNTHLVGTSYYNYASPLIRYNTEDLIEIVNNDNGLLNAFKIKQGRVGDFVLDGNNKKVSLTGLLFGRHHTLFNHVSNVQIRSVKAGLVEILYVANDDLSQKSAEKMFDSSDVNIKFLFKKINSPVKTINGKVPLKIN